MTTAGSQSSLSSAPAASAVRPNFAEELKAKFVDVPPYAAAVTLHPTAHAGHWVEPAGEPAGRGSNVLVVSGSGDGGYNETVNGILQAGNLMRSVQ